MAEDLSKLSSEDIRKFEKTISEVKAITARQEEIAKKVLDVEKTIGKVRIASLNEYFDAYSKGLDEIIARKTSQLNDAFLVMEHKALEGYKKAADSSTKATNKRTSSNASSGGSNSSGGGPGNGGGSKKPAAIKVANNKIVDDNTRAGLGEEAHTAENIVERLNAFTEKYKTVKEQTDATTKRQQDAVISIEQLKDARLANRQKAAQEYVEKEEKLEETLTALTAARLQEKRDKEAQIRAAQISHQQEFWDAELKAQELINQINAERDFAVTPEAQRLQEQKAAAEDTQKSIQQLEAQRVKYIAEEERKLKRKNQRELTAEERAELVRLSNEKYKLDEKNLTRITKKRKEAEERKAKVDGAKGHAARRAELRSELNTLRTAETFEERKQAFYNATHDEEGNRSLGKALSAAVLAVSDLAKQLDSKIDEIAGYKSAIDTRMQGSSHEKYKGSYWGQLTRDMMSVGAINPYFKQEDFARNIKTLVDKGIAFDIEQRAFLMTIQEKIATTFNVADGTLLRLIRLQQEDSTAGRLGMEASLNAFLNNMYETTEYLSDVAAGVRSSLAEMQSLMEGAEATEVEYQIQKWLGSLYSVGMSDSAVTSISNTLGQIAAGQIDGLTNNGAGNLLIMAANDAGLSIADILVDGINSSDTNKLMQAVVNYLAEIAESSKDNNVVQQQLANVFGVKASDLRAATNLASKGSIGAIYGNSMSYDNMLGYLYSMAGSMKNRTSLGEMMSNIWNNGQYSLASSMSSNPVSYFIYKMATVLDDTTGGIAIPALSFYGNMVDLETTVADLMRVAAVGSGILGSLGPMISGIGNSFSGRSMLEQLGIKSGSGLTITPRGSGIISTSGGGSAAISESGYVGNSSGSDVRDSTLQEAEDSKKQLMVEAKEEEEANQLDIINGTVLKIYELLDDVTHGSGCFKVKVEGYGLTKAGSTSAQGGVGAISSSSSSAASGGASSLSGSGVNSGGIAGSIDFGGWTTVI